MERHFEFVGGTSAKFWEVEVDGSTVRVRFGRLGVSGQQHEKHFADPATANKHAEKLIAEKLRKGYDEKSAA